MNINFLRNLGPGTQLMFVMIIAFFTLFLMQLTAFLVIRPIWGINIFESIEEIAKLKNDDSIYITKILQVFYQIGIFLLPALIFKKIFNEPDQPFFVLRQKQETSNWILAAVFFLVAFPLVNFLHFANMQIPFSEDLVTADEESKNMLMKLMGGSFAVLLVNIFVYGVIPAIVEEYLFRGVIMRQIALATKNVHIAVWVSAALFSFIHGEATVFIPRFLMGVVLGYLFMWSGTIWLGVIAHFFNNVLGIVLMNAILNNKLNSDYEMLGGSTKDILYVIISVVLSGLVLYFIYKKRNDAYRMFVAEQTRKESEREFDEDILE